MFRIKFLVQAAFAMLIAGAGCSLGPAEQEDYFPLEEGATWRYEYEATGVRDGRSRTSRGHLHWQYDRMEADDISINHFVIESFEGTTDYCYADGNNNWVKTCSVGEPLAWERMLLIIEQSGALQFQYDAFTHITPDSLWSELRDSNQMTSQPLSFTAIPQPLPRYYTLQRDTVGTFRDGYARRIWTLGVGEGLVRYDWHSQGANWFWSQKLNLVTHAR